MTVAATTHLTASPPHRLTAAAPQVRTKFDGQERFQHAISPLTGEDTPLRESSYDLLKTAATRCAFRRLYNELDRDALQV